MAEAIVQDGGVKLRLDAGSRDLAKDRIMQHLESLTVADLVREAVRFSGVDEVQMLLDEIRQEDQ